MFSKRKNNNTNTALIAQSLTYHPCGCVGVIVLAWLFLSLVTDAFPFVAFPPSQSAVPSPLVGNTGRPRKQHQQQQTWGRTIGSNNNGQSSYFYSVVRKNTFRLFSGVGIAKGYTWQEEAFEIDVTVKVPNDTRAKDLQFRATSRSIDLRLTNADGSEKVLLDGNRTLRGRVSLDGTYWVIGDVTEATDMYLASPYREVTVTIEKLIRTPKDDFEVVNYDWNGLYPDDTNEVVSRKYDGPEELDVREYATSIGVDLDNLNMSMLCSQTTNLSQSLVERCNRLTHSP